MINHARTLLLNIGPQNNTAAGAEFIDPGFQPIQLPQWMSTVRTLLYPGQFTPAQMNQRTRLFMQILHAIDLLPFTLLLDTRFTYSTSAVDLAEPAIESLDIAATVERLERLDLHSPTIAQAFATWEPYTSQISMLRVIWHQSSEAVQRFGALLLAYILQAERIRRGVPTNQHQATVTRVA